MNNNDYIKALTEKGVLAFVPNGNSMWPTLKNGKHSVIIQPKTQRLTKYQVAFFTRADGSFVLHRVIDLTEDGYLVCGDSQLQPEKVLEERVVGVMTGYYLGDKFVDANSPKHLLKIERFYKRARTRKFRIKNFNFRLRLKNKLKRIFKKKGE